MPKQVWQADDGATFDTEKECLKSEKLKKELGDLMSSYFTEDDVEERLGFQNDFGRKISDGFSGGGFEELWKYRESIIKLTKMLEG